jgi:phosphoglucosamine mutase
MTMPLDPQTIDTTGVRRRYFGTDGVRGVVGKDLTVELVEQLGRAATLWAGPGSRVFIGRDTRASGLELEEAFARGVVEAGGNALLGGVLPTPAVALLRLDLGVVISASHNPPEYNGVKFFDRDGQKLTDAAELEIEALLEAKGPGGGDVTHVEVATDSYLEHVLDRFGDDLEGMRIVVDCANGAYAGLAPRAFEELGATVHCIGDAPDGTNINMGCGATDLAALRRTVVELGYDMGIAFDGDGDRMLAVDEKGESIDGDQIVAVLALHLGVDLVAVTTMANLGFHRLMRDNGVRVVTTDVGDRYVLEALRREGGVLGGEQSGHIIYLRDHVTGDGLASALLLCRAARERPLSDVSAVMQKFPQVMRNIPSAVGMPDSVVEEADRLNAELDGDCRVLVRPSGTEPVVRVLAEAETPEQAEELCTRAEAIVRAALAEAD